MAPTALHKLDKEEAFKAKLAELGLTAKYREHSKEDRGITQMRLMITFFKNAKEIGYCGGGFWGQNSYRESAFEQGYRKLMEMEAHGTHLK